jgi:1-acyl-sn-glycerol-3-phosphate acyltransferase
MTRWIVAAAILAAVAGALILFLRAWRRTHYSLTQYVLFHGVRFLVRHQWRTELPKRLTFDPARGAVLICNHRSSVDPFFIQILFDRPARWMVAREYVEHWAFGWFLRACDVIPAARTGLDVAAIKAALRAAHHGRMVGMLPEGRINTTGEILTSCRPGPVLVALRARVPIVPIYIFDAPYGGTPASPLFRRGRARVVMGEPIDLSEFYTRRRDKAFLGELSLKIYKELARLGGQPDFEPQLAGRRWKHGIEPAIADSPG